MTRSGRLPWLLGYMILPLVACGSDGHPDSGYGANQPVPATLSCSALCERLANCAVQLCNENTSSSNYDDLEDVLASQCELGCDDDVVQTRFTAAEWSCTFTDSCRAVLEADSCMTDASYTCE